MQGYGPTTFGTLNADVYDAEQDPGTTDAAVAFISNLAPKGRLLELAIGSGRLALPLARTGLHVEGIEASQEMVDLMRAKPGGEDIPVLIDDMANVAVSGPFDYVLLAFNTVFNLPTQAEQVRLFQNTAKALMPGGAFMVEAFVPNLSAFSNHQKVATKALDMHSLLLEAVQHDPVAQTFHFQRIKFTEAGMKMTPFPMRYAYPPELDLMAQLAGLRLRERWGGWAQEPFNQDSPMHVSVYEKPQT